MVLSSDRCKLGKPWTMTERVVDARLECNVVVSRPIKPCVMFPLRSWKETLGGILRCRRGWLFIRVVVIYLAATAAAAAVPRATNTQDRVTGETKDNITSEIKKEKRVLLERDEDASPSRKFCLPPSCVR